MSKEQLENIKPLAKLIDKTENLQTIELAILQILRESSENIFTQISEEFTPQEFFAGFCKFIDHKKLYSTVSILHHLGNSKVEGAWKLIKLKKMQ